MDSALVQTCASPFFFYVFVCLDRCGLPAARRSKCFPSGLSLRSVLALEHLKLWQRWGRAVVSLWFWLWAENGRLPLRNSCCCCSPLGWRPLDKFREAKLVTKQGRLVRSKILLFFCLHVKLQTLTLTYQTGGVQRKYSSKVESARISSQKPREDKLHTCQKRFGSGLKE